MQNLTAITICLALCGGTTASGSPAAAAFSTDGHIVYHMQPANIANGARGIVAASYDGSVFCYTPKGERLWSLQPSGDFPYDLCVADIDGDQRDEALVATAGGELHAIDNNGALLWSFSRTAPLFQVAAARQADGKCLIVAGGVDQTLYALSEQGKLVGSLKTQHCIRHIRAGDILGTGRDVLAVATTSAGLTGRLSLLLVDPATMTVRWNRKNLGSRAYNSGRRFFSMEILDLDKDGREDILLSDSWGEHGRIFAFNSLGEQVFTTTDRRIPNVSYRMNLLRPVTLSDDEFVLGHFGNVLIVYELDGTCREVLTGPYSFADAAFDPVLKTLYLGSSVSGGDGIYSLRLDAPDWRQAYQSIKAVGRLKKMEQNVERLETQTAAFRPPAYQPPPQDVTVLGRKPDDRDYRRLHFVRKCRWSQKHEGRDELWCRDVDGRCRYNLTADQITENARQLEDAGQPFLIWSGHGHAVFFPLSTFRRILEAAPTALWGFEFAEMEGVDSEMQEVVEQILLPLAELCREHHKKIIFRNKNIYWSGTCYIPFLKNVLLSDRYHDVFLPALEETNCRTQEMSLAGRIGLWQSGSFDAWSCRMVTDNANWDRMWEYGGQQLPTHHLRHLASRAALGADVFFNDVHQGPFTQEVYAKLTPFYDMLEKGILQIPKRNDLLSMSGVAIGMMSPPSPAYIQHGINGHAYRYPDDTHPEMVFDRLDGYWGGSPLAEYDASRYAYGLERRQCNFLPPLPYGLVAIVPADTPAGADSPFHTVFKTDGKAWYDNRGQQQSASAYKSTVLAALETAARRLPIRVSGPAHWAVVRLDSSHVRVVLIDPGYLDPADREVEIVLQTLEGTKCVDILSNQTLPIDSQRIRVQIPAGTLRIVDIEHILSDSAAAPGRAGQGPRPDGNN